MAINSIAELAKPARNNADFQQIQDLRKTGFGPPLVEVYQDASHHIWCVCVSPEIKTVLEELRDDYGRCWRSDGLFDPATPITEVDIVAEIYGRLKAVIDRRRLSVHCEIKPVNENLPDMQIDLVVLNNSEGLWRKAAQGIQDSYDDGHIQARFSSIPVEFFHGAIEVKIQSKLYDSKKDIHKRAKGFVS